MRARGHVCVVKGTRNRDKRLFQLLDKRDTDQNKGHRRHKELSRIDGRAGTRTAKHSLIVVKLYDRHDKRSRVP
jgi:hypothetical protein